MKAAAGIIRGQTTRERVCGGHAEPRVLIPAVAPTQARPDREQPGIAVADDVIAAGHRNPSFVAGDALANLTTQPAAVGKVVCYDRSALGTDLDLRQRCADVLGIARAFEIQRRADLQPARPEQREVKALVGRLEMKRFAAARPVEVEHRPDVELVRSWITWVNLR